jgi:hypothetical protein
MMPVGNKEHGVVAHSEGKTSPCLNLIGGVTKSATPASFLACFFCVESVLAANFRVPLLLSSFIVCFE